MTATCRRIVLASRPKGFPTAENFRLEDAPLPALAEGDLLVRVTHLSLDPYMRGRMDDAASYAAPQALDETMVGGAVGEVLDSRAPGFAPGDLVFGMFGWCSHAVHPAAQCRKLDPDLPPSTALGVLGMPGFTAWSGLAAYGRMARGETLAVAAATGPVGSMVGQLARRAGLRAVGIAGGQDKCDLATGTFGFDACIDHRAHADARAMREALSAACPSGIDIYFENVGGKVLGGALPLMALHGRIIVCGMIAWYSGEADETGAIPLQKVWRMALVKRLTIQGLLQTDHTARFGEFLAEVAPLVKSGEIAWLEDTAEGLENTPAAFFSMLKGGNTGKQVVRL